MTAISHYISSPLIVSQVNSLDILLLFQWMSSSQSSCRQTEIVFHVWACDIFMFCLKIFLSDFFFFFYRYECVYISDIALVAGGGVRLWSYSLHVDLIGHREKAFCHESPRWQRTRNLWLPHVPSPTIPLKVFRRVNPLPRLPTREICWWQEACLCLSSTFRGLEFSFLLTESCGNASCDLRFNRVSPRDLIMQPVRGQVGSVPSGCTADQILYAQGDES